MKNPIRLIVSRDEEKAHSLGVVFGNDYGVHLGIQWRGYEPNDDGNDPWMLYVSAFMLAYSGRLL